MKHLLQISLYFALLLGSSAVWATKIHECEDEQGNRSFQKHCPPGSKVLAEKQYSDGRSLRPANETSLPVLVLYAVPNCEVCDQMRDDLSARNIQVTEKNIRDNGELQLELKSKTGGDLRVPVLLIGEKVVSGYDREALTTALTDAGYVGETADKK